MQPGVLARIAPLASSAYFLDVDGTLFEIKPRPENVVADEKLRTLLACLPGLRVARSPLSASGRLKISTEVRAELHRLLADG
jgi:hypothetical protein